MKITNKIVEKKNKIVKKYKKLMANVRWETRYKNLEKKYNILIEENKELEKEISKDVSLKKIEYYKKYTEMLKKQRDNLRKGN